MVPPTPHYCRMNRNSFGKGRFSGNQKWRAWASFNFCSTSNCAVTRWCLEWPEITSSQLLPLANLGSLCNWTCLRVSGLKSSLCSPKHKIIDIQKIPEDGVLENSTTMHAPQWIVCPLGSCKYANKAWFPAPGRESGGWGVTTEALPWVLFQSWVSYFFYLLFLAFDDLFTIDWAVLHCMIPLLYLIILLNSCSNCCAISISRLGDD